jgi:hypothetical protein
VHQTKKPPKADAKMTILFSFLITNLPLISTNNVLHHSIPNDWLSLLKIYTADSYCVHYWLTYHDKVPILLSQLLKIHVLCIGTPWFMEQLYHNVPIIINGIVWDLLQKVPEHFGCYLNWLFCVVQYILFLILIIFMSYQYEWVVCNYEFLKKKKKNTRCC